MNDPAANSGVSSSLLGRHSVLDTESSRVFWIPAFAGMTNSPQAAGNTTQREFKNPISKRIDQEITFYVWSLEVLVISYCFEFRASNFGFVDPVRVGKRGSNTSFVLKVLGIFQ